MKNKNFVDNYKLGDTVTFESVTGTLKTIIREVVLEIDELGSVYEDSGASSNE